MVRGAVARRAAALPLLTVAAVALGGPAAALAQSGSSSVLGGAATTSPFSPGLPRVDAVHPHHRGTDHHVHEQPTPTAA